MDRLLCSLRTAAACLVLAAPGCAFVQSAPLTELAQARAAIVQAEHAGAARAAPDELSSARQRLSDAEQLQSRDPDLARWRAGEAESDARLAEAIAEDARAQVAAANHGQVAAR
jgi:Domain of unknown function (DUF4398)